jgi:hypothetical protein
VVRGALGWLETDLVSGGSSRRSCFDADSNRSKIVSPPNGTCAGGTVTHSYAYATGTHTPVERSPAGQSAVSYGYAGGGSADGTGR